VASATAGRDPFAGVRPLQKSGTLLVDGRGVALHEAGSCLGRSGVCRRGESLAARRKKKQAEVESYRHDKSRKNDPPVKIVAEGHVPLIPQAQYHDSPRRPPTLRFERDGKPDALPELLREAKRRHERPAQGATR